MNQNRRLCLTRRIASGVAACSLGVFLAAGAPVQVCLLYTSCSACEQRDKISGQHRYQRGHQEEKDQEGQPVEWNLEIVGKVLADHASVFTAL